MPCAARDCPSSDPGRGVSVHVLAVLPQARGGWGWGVRGRPRPGSRPILVMRIAALLLKPISDWSQVLDRVLLASALAFS